MKVVAIVDRSVGNETVGEMWQETQVFDSGDPIEKILEWVNGNTSGKMEQLEEYGSRFNLKITVPKAKS